MKTPGSVTRRALAAALVIFGLGSCTSVLALDPFKSASDGLCEILDGCYQAGAIADCRAHIDATLGDAGLEAGDGWLTALSDDGCLDTCTSARACLDRDPICITGACSTLEDCCGFTTGRTDCQGGLCCLTAGQQCATDEQCCASAGACDQGHCGGTVCRVAETACDIDAECCSKQCVHGACAATICVDDGFDCADALDCCSRFCDPRGRCGEAPCGQAKASCTADADCCAPEVCFRPAGIAVGLCSTGQCLPLEVDCSLDAQCCSGHCDPAYDVCGVACGAVGAACDAASPCCNGACTKGFCAEACSTASCQGDADCCSPERCVSGTCTPKCEDVACDHTLCEIGGPLSATLCAQEPPQGAAACVAEVCHDDPYCCCGSWDSLCVYEVSHPSSANADLCANLCSL